MDNKNLTREIIHTISRHSNWQTKSIEKNFVESGIYADKKSWIKFFHFFLISLGVSFTISGIIFFFAFNWADMHKFFKLGLVETLIITCISVVLMTKTEDKVKNIILSGASLLVGALFAVFGQIYQTGANAYDFFLGWTIFIALWAAVSNFPPLWLVFLVLLNTTIVLYSEQVARVLFFVNSFFVILIELLFSRGILKKRTKWFINTVALGVIIPITISIIYGIFDNYDDHSDAFKVSILLGAISFGSGMVYGLKSKNLFYVSSISFSIIIIISSLLIKHFNDPIGIFFIVSIFIIGSTTALIRQIIKLNKQWHGIK